MKCFIDYVGLEYCSSEEPVSEFYINQMPGISVKALDNIANAEKKNFRKVWNDIQARAVRLFKHEVLNAISDRVKVSLSYSTDRFGQFPNEYIPIDDSGNFVGLRIYGNLYQFFNLSLFEFDFYSVSAVAGARFYLYDVNQSKQIKEITVDLTEGFNSIPLNFEFSEPRYQTSTLFLYYDADLIQTVTSLGNYPESSFDDRRVYVTGARVNGKGSVNINTVVSSGGSSGMSLRYAIDCSLDAYICTIRNQFLMPFVYLLCAEFIKEKLHSDRLNRYTSDMTLEEGSALITDYELKFRNQLDTLIYNIKMPSNQCFSCNERIQQVYVKP